ncbi:MAG: hypothetical protein JJE17_03590 [Peptostreptococcaceae bacterium]|nr:hypothetical protein [Peptostreptococcaceae bacterium]
MKKEKKFFTALVVFLPILSLYKTPVPGFDLGTLVLILSCFLYLLRKRLIFTQNKFFFIFTIYVFIFSLISYLLLKKLNTDTLLIFLRLAKFSLFSIFFMMFDMFDFEFGIIWLKRITLVAVVMIIVQTISVNIFHFYVPGVIYRFADAQVYADQIQKMKDSGMSSLFFFRPSSIFYEPGQFAQYCYVYLCYCLFSEKRISRENLFNSVFISIGLILSTSGQGILILTFFWIGFGLNNFFSQKFSYFKLFSGIFLLVTIIFAFSVILKLPIFSKSMDRVIDNSSGFHFGVAVYGRFLSYSLLKDLSLYDFLFGVGFGNVTMYMPTVSQIIHTSGLFGIVLFFLFLVSSFFKGDSFQKWGIIVFFGLCIGANLFTAVNIWFYFSFFLSRRKNIMFQKYAKSEYLLHSSCQSVEPRTDIFQTGVNIR